MCICLLSRLLDCIVDLLVGELLSLGIRETKGDVEVPRMYDWMMAGV